MTITHEQTAKIEAFDVFTDVWNSDTIGDIATSLTCIEFDALIDLVVAGGMGPETAKMLTEMHGEGDDCGDSHCLCDDEECIAERSA